MLQASDVVQVPQGVFYGAILGGYAAMGTAIAWLAKQLYKERRERRRERMKDAYVLKRARFAVERSQGVPSTPPPPLTEWKDDSAIIEQEKLETAMWLERRLAAEDAADRTPEHVQLPRVPPRPRTPPKIR